MAQNRLITELASLVTPNNNDVFVIVDNTSNPSLSITKKITYANLKEDLQDMINTLFQEGNGIDAVYSDPSNTLTISVVPDTTVQKTVVSSGGTEIGTRQEINVIPGAAITLSGVDNPAENRVDLTINTTAVTSGTNITVSGVAYNIFSDVDTQGDGTRRVRLRPIKAGSNKTVVSYSDGGNAVSIDIDPSQISLDSLSSASPLGVARGGTGASTAGDARANLGAAKAGQNSDITSLSGITTPLSVSQGGTGANNGDDGLQNIGGLKRIDSVTTLGESIVASGTELVGNEYRGRLKGIKSVNPAITITSNSTDVLIDSASSIGMDYQEFTSNGTWTKPAGVNWVEVEVIGGGGGGGGGAKTATNAAIAGGGGGWGSPVIRKIFAASSLGSTESVTIGAGGTGGASVTTNSTAGNDGTDGGVSSFGSHIVGGYGTRGQGGLLGTSVPNVYRNASPPRSMGDIRVTTGWSAMNIASPGFGDPFAIAGIYRRDGGPAIESWCAGGGAGGGYSSSSFTPGGQGGWSTSSSTLTELGGQTDGASGGNADSGSLGGGGGGASSLLGNAGNGGNGAIGGGAGGGGASVNSVGNSGVGGNGGSGRIRIWAW